MQFLPLFTDEYLFSHWEDEFQEYLELRDAGVRNTLLEWNGRDKSLTEIQLNGLFVEKIFHQLWNYWGTGTVGPTAGYTLLPEYPVSGAGQSGGTGKADLALAHFGNDELSDIPQVLCEFKDIKSGLDTPQNRKGSNRSPVQQCLNYLKHSFDKTPVNSTLVPSWGIVTDMNEFRLYHRKTGNTRCLRFVIDSGIESESLIANTPAAARQRFLFCKLFLSEFLLAQSGICKLEKLLKRQWIYEKVLEKNFYKEYQAYRQHVYEAVLESNPSFTGTRGELVRMTQRFLDRCIFLLFCEDMGAALSFPTDLLRDILIRESMSPSFSPEFDNIWSLIKQLFQIMREGGSFPPNYQINKFNGGLFEDIKQLESLRIPNRIFCAKGQGENAEKLGEEKNTLLYLSAAYNFGTTSATREHTITLYTLGRIFEQSITDLEYMHAEADGVPTIAKLSKRKRDGVYYTPEWVTGYIVQYVVGKRLEEERQHIGLQFGVEISDDDLKKYSRRKKKPKTNPVTIHIQRLECYQEFLNQITILDPACGSGAFLIQALQFLMQHHHDVSVERERVTGQLSLFDHDEIIRSIVSNNLFGVDINPESVEITQLALWLNTAVPDKPLSTLSGQILCGNSLVGDDFAQYYQEKYSTLFEDIDPNEQEKVNTFDWAKNYPAVMGLDIPEQERGFDCIVGNPPYVKLQHFRKIVPDVAEYLVEAQQSKIANADISQVVTKVPLYKSTQTKNFDLYLPFIERGISLLNTKGHMGYIAPSVWLLNDYGEGLKKQLVDSRRLERWVDFKDFPVFDEAMTYTALQFFGGQPASSVAFAAAADGQLTAVEDEGVINYDSLDPNDAWVFLPESERQLIDKLNQSCTRLNDFPQVSSIFQGVITSADYIYHLMRVGPGRYRHAPPKQDHEEVLLEDAIMRPLLSGTEAKRYQSPQTNKYILFPYDDSDDEKHALYSADQMKRHFPKAWNHLRRYESELRARERSSFDDDQWYRFGRNQNIDKQSLKKLGVAQTVPEMRVFYDSDGEFCLNNVRVNGILVEESWAWFILGILNSRVADFIFRRIAKPKEPRPSGAYFEANKQYIAPIPIPNVDLQQVENVTVLAQTLQALHSSRRDAIYATNSRINSSQMRPDKRNPSWIWADVRDPAVWSELNPNGLQGRKLNGWAKCRYEQLLETHLSDINDRITFGQPMHAIAEDGQLKFFVGNECVIEGVYVSEEEADIILPQWQEKARDTFASETMDARRILTRLLDLRITENKSLINQLATGARELKEIEEQIIQTEREMDDYVYTLYRLDADEQRIIELDTEKRANARIPRVQH